MTGSSSACKGIKYRFPCNSCSKTFSSRSHMIRHARCFHAKRSTLRFRCPVNFCQRKYHRMDVYRAHLLDAHGNDEQRVVAAELDRLSQLKGTRQRLPELHSILRDLPQATRSQHPESAAPLPVNQLVSDLIVNASGGQRAAPTTPTSNDRDIEPVGSPLAIPIPSPPILPPPPVAQQQLPQSVAAQLQASMPGGNGEPIWQQVQADWAAGSLTDFMPSVYAELHRRRAALHSRHWLMTNIDAVSIQQTAALTTFSHFSRASGLALPPLMQWAGQTTLGPISWSYRLY
eukprot:TRINITY_DN6125_c0_g1_i1.p1 TRINITY_DN6125_c0_g1~~TRINITY_DN6125_c0_g1_i1.p1  ORF type:complete len:288 (+),score=26.99 TRINITY_DN6125_c0_g1_i1:256-1119(+)